MNEQRITKTEGTVVYLLKLLRQTDLNNDPLKTISYLFMLKSTIEKWMTPRMAFWCVENDIVAVLLRILSKEFRPQDKNDEPVVYSLAMEILWLLSRLGRPTVEHMVAQSNLVATLSRFLNVSDGFYRFGADFQRCLRRWCCGVTFSQQKVIAVPVSEKIWNDLLSYAPSMKMWCSRIRPFLLHRCHLTLQNGKMAHNVSSLAARLISERLAWAPAQRHPDPRSSPALFRNIGDLTHPPLHVGTALCSLPSDDQDEASAHIADSHLEHEDVHILAHLGGTFFWAYIGCKALEMVNDITDLLHKAVPSLRKADCPCVGDVVVVLEKRKGLDQFEKKNRVDGSGKRNALDQAVKTEERDQPDQRRNLNRLDQSDEAEDQHWPAAMRGRVVDVCKGEVTVFAMDYGRIRKIRVCDIYQLSDSVQHLSSVEGEAKLCCLAGVQAPPASVSAVDFALATLTNLAGHSSNAAANFVDLRAVDHLHVLLSCDSPSLQLQASRLLCNISSVPKISATVDWSCFIRPLLERLVQLSGLLCHPQELDNLHRNLVVVTLFALTNILHRKPANHELFFHLQGHIIVLNVLRVSRHNQAVMQAAVGALKTVYPAMIPMAQENQPSDRRQPVRKKEKTASSEPQRIADGGVKGSKSFSDSGITDKMQRSLSPVSKTEKAGKADERQRNDSDPGETLLTTSSRDVADMISGTAVGVMPVDSTSVSSQTEKVYVYDTCLPYRDDQTHHLLHVNSIRSVGVDTVLDIVCGMLNSEGGTLFIGLTKQGRVQGLLLDREDRDCVRLGVDAMMSRMVPAVAFNLIHLQYVQVVRRVSDGTLKPDIDTFVIELHVKAPEELQFYVKGGVCFQRLDFVNRRLSEQEVRELAVRQEESKYLPLLASLQRQIQLLRQ